ncbi:hypothetical protein AB0368_09795 [Actinoplanes sp. NPDC051475]|uniref:hypothetical protein n=1 Tax=Actinoplanes sp. NPDC051475 TaxID=3157225 RepID=UPI00344C71D4
MLLPVASPAHAEAPAREVMFWESPGFADDGVRLGPAPAQYDLRGVTRDCWPVCLADWNNVPASLQVGSWMVLTVWDGELYTGACANFDGGADGHAVRDLADVSAGLPAGEHWRGRISSIRLTPYGSASPLCQWAQNPVGDGSFEGAPGAGIASPWATEGPGWKGIDRTPGAAHDSRALAFINTDSTRWNALTQAVSLPPHQTYKLRAWVRTSGTYDAGFFGIRRADGTVLQELRFGATDGKYRLLTVSFNSENAKNFKVFVGYWGPGRGSWLQADNVFVEAAF